MPEKVKFDDALKAVVNALVVSSDKDAIEQNQEAFERLAYIYDNYSSNQFWDAVRIGQHKFERILAQFMEVPPQKNLYITEHVVSGLYTHFWDKYFEKHEGGSCRGDKSSFVTKMTIKALKSKDNLPLYDDYMKCERIKEDKEKQAYWSPLTVPDTDTAMSLFWDWYLLRDNEQTA